MQELTAVLVVPKSMATRRTWCPALWVAIESELGGLRICVVLTMVDFVDRRDCRLSVGDDAEGPPA